MAIRLRVTRGYGNGTFSGTIAKSVTRGFSIGSVVVSDSIYCVNLAHMNALGDSVSVSVSAENLGLSALLDDEILAQIHMSLRNTVVDGSDIDDGDHAIETSLEC